MSDNQEDPVEVLVLEYLRASEEGESPDLVRMQQQLATDAQRTEFRELCEAVGYAQKHFPEQLRPETLVAGRFLLKRHLGSGGFAKVWLAFDQRTGHQVALKVFHALRDDAAIQRDLAREKTALSGLRHDGIVRLLDYGKHEDAYFLSMDYVQGRSLEQALIDLAKERNAYPPSLLAVEAAFDKPPTGEQSQVESDWFRTTAKLMCGVLWALHVAHTHQPKVVHRDLKPSNVLIRRGGKPVLVDFGLAGVGNAEGDVTGMMIGTVPYYAPEQLKSGKIGKAELTDVYQAGLLLYEMLTLQRAFPQEDLRKVQDAIKAGAFERPRRVRKQIPQLLEDICMRALELDPSRRYQSASEFRDDLERWLDGQLPVASKLGTFGRWIRAGRMTLWRNRIVAALLVAIATGALAVYSATETQPNVNFNVVDAGWAIEVTTDKPVLAIVYFWEPQPGGSKLRRLAPVQTEGHSQGLAIPLPAGTHKLPFLSKVDIDGQGRGISIADKPIADSEAYRAFTEMWLAREQALGRGLTTKELVAIADELKDTKTRGPDEQFEIDLSGIIDEPHG